MSATTNAGWLAMSAAMGILRPQVGPGAVPLAPWRWLGLALVPVDAGSTAHAADTSTVEARVDAIVRESFENHGKQTLTRNVTVTVE